MEKDGFNRATITSTYYPLIDDILLATTYWPILIRPLKQIGSISLIIL